MDIDLLVTAIATISGVVVGSFTTYQLEKQRRKHETNLVFRNEKKSVYATFMSCVVRWENEIAWRWQARYLNNADKETLEISKRRIEELHQATMAPLFELRMVGSAAVVSAAEDIMQYVYFYESEHDNRDFDKIELDNQWLLKRDNFIAKVREEITEAHSISRDR